jgi:hypothetical protein
MEALILLLCCSLFGLLCFALVGDICRVPPLQVTTARLPGVLCWGAGGGSGLIVEARILVVE